jgi:hypothetical protein
MGRGLKLIHGSPAKRNLNVDLVVVVDVDLDFDGDGDVNLAGHPLTLGLAPFPRRLRVNG